MSETDTVNRLLAHLPTSEIERFKQDCEVVDMQPGAALSDVNEDLQSVYFPFSGFISLVIAVKGHPPMQIALVGNEGMLGASLVLGIKTSPLQAVVRGAGIALKMDASAFSSYIHGTHIQESHLQESHLQERHAQEAACLQRIINRYLYVMMVQSSHSTACTHFHEVEARLARWLLAIQDCAQSSHFCLTHQFLADMLGVQRSAVTIAAGALKHQRLISYSRGDITIIDRAGLKAASCECYAVVSNDYEKLLGTAAFDCQ